MKKLRILMGNGLQFGQRLYLCSSKRIFDKKGGGTTPTLTGRPFELIYYEAYKMERVIGEERKF